MDSWYTRFRQWFEDGYCIFSRKGIDPFKKVIDPATFRMCLIWGAKDNFQGAEYFKDVYFDDDGNITSFYLSIKSVDLGDPGEVGAQFLDDLRSIELNFALEGTYSYALQFIDFEVYAVLE